MSLELQKDSDGQLNGPKGAADTRIDSADAKHLSARHDASLMLTFFY